MRDTSMIFQKVLLAVKKNKIFYYVLNFLEWMVPYGYYERQLQRKLAALDSYDLEDVMDRVNYYNRLEPDSTLGEESMPLIQVKKFKTPKAYYFDTFKYSRYFPRHLRINLLVGDINYVGEFPAIQKSRPINSKNANGVLLKLDRKRHFIFISDSIPYKDKKDMLIGRAAIRQPHRERFMELYYGHEMCDLGQVNKNGGNLEWLKPKISLFAHLNYKFILSLEGYDVATNLKWIMSSNSIAVMPRPKYETWFMEGKLIADFHYISIKDDYSDLEEKLRYYIDNPDEAMEIIKNANAYVKQFWKSAKEDLISVLVLKKYFECTSQINSIS